MNEQMNYPLGAFSFNAHPGDVHMRKRYAGTATQLAPEEDVHTIQPDQRTTKSRSASPAVCLLLLQQSSCRILAVIVASELLSKEKTILFS